MRKTLHSPDYARFLGLLKQARKDAGIVQQELADKLGKPRCFIAKVERGERRIDVIEFIAIARAIGRDPVRLLKQHILQDPLSKPRSALGRWVLSIRNVTPTEVTSSKFALRQSPTLFGRAVQLFPVDRCLSWIAPQFAAFCLTAG
jgi:transcriptional regulator with XRE-family HTH domain